jgi:hypothetical protein
MGENRFGQAPRSSDWRSLRSSSSQLPAIVHGDVLISGTPLAQLLHGTAGRDQGPSVRECAEMSLEPTRGVNAAIAA